MKEEVSIVRADETHIDRMVQLVRTSFDERYLIASIYRCKGIRTFIENECNNPYSPYIYWVALYKDQIIGFCEFKCIPETQTAFLNMIATDVNFKGKGIANLIFEYAYAYFKNKKCTSIQLDVFESNTLAKGWYEKLNFSTISQTYFYKIKPSSVRTKEPIYITNATQYKILYDTLEFSFVQASSQNNSCTIGVIKDAVIIRDLIGTEHIISSIVDYISTFPIQTLYGLGEDTNKENYIFLDKIYRMKLIL